MSLRHPLRGVQGLKNDLVQMMMGGGSDQRVIPRMGGNIGPTQKQVYSGMRQGVASLSGAEAMAQMHDNPNLKNFLLMAMGAPTGGAAGMVPLKAIDLGKNVGRLERASRRGDSVFNVVGGKIPFSSMNDMDARRKLAREFAGDYLSNVPRDVRKASMREARDMTGVPVHYNMHDAQDRHIGSVSYRMHPDKVYIDGVWVDPSARNTRAAFHLLDQPVNAAKERGLPLDAYITEKTGALARIAQRAAKKKGVNFIGASHDQVMGGGIRAMIDHLNANTGRRYPGAH